jgi:8-oxo-dGTP pyrophosphatase MutT (NUDIX family)
MGDKLVYTVRRSDLSTHAGQISFPGGKRDPSDADATATALREAAEEMALPPEAVEVVGVLDDVPTPTGFIITPIIGCVRGEVQLIPHAREVAEIFVAPLDELRRPEIYRSDGTREWMGVEYVMHEYHFDGHRIWGATARITHQLLEIL